MPFEEVDAMLAERIQQWYREHEERGLQQGLQQGLQRGRQEGRQEGHHEAEVRLLSKMLALRFGPLAPAVAERLNASTADERSVWAERLLSVSTLDEVFAPVATAG